MSAPWSVDLAVASYGWTVTNLDPATPGPAAPLTLRHALPDDQLWPSQPLPMVATFGLVAADAADLAGVVEGADVHVAFTAPPNPDPVYFDGDVSDVEIDPVSFTPAPGADAVDGVRVSVTAVGYLAQLWEEPTTITEGTGDPDNNGATDAINRLNTLFNGEEGADPPPFTWPEPAPDMTNAAGTLAPNWIWNDFPLRSMAPLNISGEAMGPHVDAVLRIHLWATTTDPNGDVKGLQPPKRIILEANVDPVTRALESPYAWKAALVSNQVAVPAAADFALTPSGWGVVPDPDAGGAVISAGMIERDIRFTQRKRSNVTRVAVPYYDTADSKFHSLSSTTGRTPTVLATLPGDGGDLPAVSRQSTGLTTGPGSNDNYLETPENAIRRVADFYLPEGHADAWGADTVTWRMDRDAPGRTPPALGSLVVVAGVSESQNPNGRTWISGIVKSWTLTLPDGTVELDLLPSLGKETGDPAGDRLTWADLPAGVTWDQLRPDHTWADYDLLRGP